MAWLKKTNHPAYFVLKNDPMLLNEETGEITFSVLSRGLTGGQARSDIGHANEMFQFTKSQLQTAADLGEDTTGDSEQKEYSMHLKESDIARVAEYFKGIVLLMKHGQYKSMGKLILSSTKNGPSKTPRIMRKISSVEALEKNPEELPTNVQHTLVSLTISPKQIEKLCAKTNRFNIEASSTNGKGWLRKDWVDGVFHHIDLKDEYWVNNISKQQKKGSEKKITKKKKKSSQSKSKRSKSKKRKRDNRPECEQMLNNEHEENDDLVHEEVHETETYDVLDENFEDIEQEEENEIKESKWDDEEKLKEKKEEENDEEDDEEKVCDEQDEEDKEDEEGKREKKEKEVKMKNGDETESDESGDKYHPEYIFDFLENPHQDGQDFYCVKWKGYSKKDYTLADAGEMENANPHLIDEYVQREARGLSHGPKKRKTKRKQGKARKNKKQKLK